MANSQQGNEYKEKFRPDADPALDREIDAALGGLSVEQLYDFDKPQPQSPGSKRSTSATRASCAIISSNMPMVRASEPACVRTIPSSESPPRRMRESIRVSLTASSRVPACTRPA